MQNLLVNHQTAQIRQSSLYLTVNRAGLDQVFERDSQQPYSVSAAELYNPILGISEGEIKKHMARREMKELLTLSQKSSQSRSRSKSKLARLKEMQREAIKNREEGIIGQMKRFEV